LKRAHRALVVVEHEVGNRFHPRTQSNALCPEPSNTVAHLILAPPVVAGAVERS
jgi:hypothetical protein